jgi:hypothetical protein
MINENSVGIETFSEYFDFTLVFEKKRHSVIDPKPIDSLEFLTRRLELLEFMRHFQRMNVAQLVPRYGAISVQLHAQAQSMGP